MKIGGVKVTQEKILMGVAIGLGAYVLLRGIRGAAADITGGVISGVGNAAYGALLGAYTALPEAVKPSSDQNIIYQGASKAVQALPGVPEGETLGGFLGDYPRPFDYLKKLIGG